MSSTPLDGIRVVELAGLAPVPFATLLLADYGASVLRVDRVQALTHSDELPSPTADILTRHKTSIAIDLKLVSGVALLRDILKQADVLIEPFRPGVLESLGLDPPSLLGANPRLIIARLTGFRRDGKYSSMAGHDINYLSVAGVLSQLGRAKEKPYAPGNILADFAGGGLPCALGIIMALFVREKTGKGQVIEHNMVDGSAYLGTFMRLLFKSPLWNQPRGENLLDGGCPWYDVYECQGGDYMAVGALEPQFFAELLKGLGMSPNLLARRDDRSIWPALRNKISEIFKEKTRGEWEAIFDSKDACCTPVLGQAELEAQEYEQRLPVHLVKTPGKSVPQEEAWTPKGLPPSFGGEDTLHTWFGWSRGRYYEVEAGGLVKKGKASL